MEEKSEESAEGKLAEKLKEVSKDDLEILPDKELPKEKAKKEEGEGGFLLEGNDFPGLDGVGEDFGVASQIERELAKEEEIIVDPHEHVDYGKIQLSSEIQTKQYDQFGIPWEQSQKMKNVVVAGEDLEGEVIFSVTNHEMEPQPLKPSIDIDPEKMTEEQKEVFDALNYDGEEPIYEELEEDFIERVNEGKDLVFEKHFVHKEKPKSKKKGSEETKKKKELEGEDSRDERELEKLKKIPEKRKVKKEAVKPQKEKAIKEAEDEGWEDEEEEEAEEFPEEERPIKKPDISSKEFKKIIKEHLGSKKDTHPKKGPKRREIESEEENEEEEEGEEKEKLDFDYNNPEKNVFYKFGEQLHTKTIYAPIPLEQDEAMKRTMAKDAVAPDLPEFEERELSLDEETHEISILTETNSHVLNKDQVLAQLTIIKEDGEVQKKKKNQRVERPKEPQVVVKRVTPENMIPEVQKGESKEDRKKRKEMVKALKQGKREKKQKFKEEFENEKKHALDNRKKNLTNTIVHASVHKY